MRLGPDPWIHRLHEHRQNPDPAAFPTHPPAYSRLVCRCATLPLRQLVPATPGPQDPALAAIAIALDHNLLPEPAHLHTTPEQTAGPHAARSWSRHCPDVSWTAVLEATDCGHSLPLTAARSLSAET